MPEVTLKINKRGYSLSCDQGQEQRLTELSQYVDGRLNDIAAAGAATNEAHLLVLTSLVLADEVYELKDEVAQMNDYIHQLRNSGSVSSSHQSDMSAQDEALIADAIEYLAAKIERIASRLQTVDEATKAA